MKFLRFAGPSNQGKTTYILSLLQELKKREKTVGILKHSHHPITLPPHKDSTQYTQQQADYSLVVGQNNALFTLPSGSKTPTEWAQWLFPDADIVLIEGWRAHSFPTILVAVSEPPPDWVYPQKIIGYVGWCPNSTLPQYDDVTSVADMLE